MSLNGDEPLLQDAQRISIIHFLMLSIVLFYLPVWYHFFLVKHERKKRNSAMKLNIIIMIIMIIIIAFVVVIVIIICIKLLKSSWNLPQVRF